MCVCVCVCVCGHPAGRKEGGGVVAMVAHTSWSLLINNSLWSLCIVLVRLPGNHTPPVKWRYGFAQQLSLHNDHSAACCV